MDFVIFLESWDPRDPRIPSMALQAFFPPIAINRTSLPSIVSHVASIVFRIMNGPSLELGPSFLWGMEGLRQAHGRLSIPKLPKPASKRIKMHCAKALDEA